MLRLSWLGGVGITALLLLCASPAQPLHAQDAARPAPRGSFSAATLWETFTQHLRRGEMDKAYACFSPLSRHVFSHTDFITHYHPITAMSAATLSPIDDGQFRVQGDLAQLRYLAKSQAPTADPKQARGGLFVTALLVREEGRWYLVAAAREAEARLEAETRNLMRRLWRTPAVRNALIAGHAISDAHLTQGQDTLFATSEGALIRNVYQFRLTKHQGTLRLEARAQKPGLRHFAMNVDESIFAIGSNGQRWRLDQIPPGVADAALPTTANNSEIAVPPMPAEPGRTPEAMPEPSITPEARQENTTSDFVPPPAPGTILPSRMHRNPRPDLGAPGRQQRGVEP